MHNAVKNEGEDRTVDKLFNFRPVFFTAIFFSFGIVFAYARIVCGVSGGWRWCLLPVALAPFFFCRSRKQVLKTLLAVVCLTTSFCFGELSLSAKLSDYTANQWENDNAIVTGRVVEKSEYSYSARLIITDLKLEGKFAKGKLIAYLPPSFAENVALSDKVILEGYVQKQTEYTDEYGFAANTIGQDIRFAMVDVEKCVVTGHRFDVFATVQTRMRMVVYAGMDQETAAVTMAILTGDTSGIEGGLLENIRMGGIAHVFAVSGLHIGSLFAFCLLLIRKTKLSCLPKPVCFLITALILVFYTCVCGFSASAVRAAVICLIAYAAKLIGIPSDLLSSLGAAALVILVFSPTALFEVGFQLSFAACLGLALLARPLEKWGNSLCEWVKIFFKKWFSLKNIARPNPKRDGEDAPPDIPERVRKLCISFLSASFSAQIATAPILLHAFGYLSGWGLLLNCIFVPLVSACFALLLLFVALSCVLPTSFAVAILYLPSVVWSALLLIFYVVDFSTFSITGVNISLGGCICYYSGWQFISDKWNITKKQKILLFIACFLTFGITMYALNV